MKKNKLMLAAILLNSAASTEIFASSFNIGVATGFERWGVKRHEDFFDNNRRHISTDQHLVSVSKKNTRPIWEIFFSYVHKIKSFGLGLELSANFQTIKQSRSFAWSVADPAGVSPSQFTFNSSIKKKPSLSFNTQIGYFVNDKLFTYLIAGLSMLRMSYQAEGSATNINHAPGINAKCSYRKGYRQIGFNYGIGVAYKVGQDVKLIAEAYGTHAKERKTSFPFSNDIRLTKNTSDVAKLKPSGYGLKVKVAWSF